MGRYYPDRRYTVSECAELDAAKLHARLFCHGRDWTELYSSGCWFSGEGVRRAKWKLAPLASGSEVCKVRLDHSIDSIQLPEKTVELVSTLTGFGRRWWWKCPRCKRRCQKLYITPSAGPIWCRVCHNLSYRCQNYNHRAWNNTKGFSSVLGQLEAAMQQMEKEERQWDRHQATLRLRRYRRWVQRPYADAVRARVLDW
jgi:hypothetical protein